MGSIEQVPQRRQEQAEALRELPVANNKVQAELIKLRWAREHQGHGAADDLMMMEWIDSGAAEKYRAFVDEEEHAAEHITMDRSHLVELLEKIDRTPTLH